MRGIDAMSFREAARVMRVSHPTVHRRWQRLVGRLQTLAQVDALAQTGRIADQQYHIAKLHWGGGWSIRRIASHLGVGRERISDTLRRTRTTITRRRSRV